MVKSCFIISTIGEEDTDERKDADDKFDLVFEPILNEMDYDAVRADKVGTPGSISLDIIRRVLESDLVIADISDENPNVFYELAVRNAVKKPVIVFRGVGQRMPFDVYDTRAITLDMKDPRIWPKAKNELKTQIDQVDQDSENASRSILSELAFTLETGNEISPEQQNQLLIKDIMSELRNIRREISLGRYPSRLVSSQTSPEYFERRASRERTIVDIPKKNLYDKDIVSLFIDYPPANDTSEVSLRVTILDPDRKVVTRNTIEMPSSPITAAVGTIDNWDIEGIYTITVRFPEGFHKIVRFSYRKKKE